MRTCFHRADAVLERVLVCRPATVHTGAGSGRGFPLKTIRIVVAGALAAVLVFATFVNPAPARAQAAEPVAADARIRDTQTPLQQALSETLAVQAAAGAPLPAEIQFHTDVQYGGPPDAEQAQSYTLTGTTVVTFDNPQQAGLEAWPALVVSDVQNAGTSGVVHPGDYSAPLREWLAGELPGIWDIYEFGQEPRRYTFTEKVSVTYAEVESGKSYNAGGIQATTSEKTVLVGFATSGPDWDYTLKESWETCIPVLGCVEAAWIRAGFALDWNFGFHLPIAIDQTAQRPMVLGSNPISVTMRGLDWTPEELADQPFDLAGNDEFVLSAVVFAGVQARVAGITVANLAADTDFEKSESFATPMGKGEEFPLPKQVFPAASIGTQRGVPGILTIGVGLSLEPNIVTDGVKAEWSASQEGQGSGSLYYTAAGVPQQYGEIIGVDEIRDLNRTVVTLDTIQYTFQSFGLDFGACPEFNLFGFGDARVCVEILRDVSLDSLFGGLYVPPFEGKDLAITHAFGVEGLYWAYLPTLAEGP
jgi:hypothetical protein